LPEVTGIAGSVTSGASEAGTAASEGVGGGDAAGGAPAQPAAKSAMSVHTKSSAEVLFINSTILFITFLLSVGSAKSGRLCTVSHKTTILSIKN
jgi:hypothetical protein